MKYHANNHCKLAVIFMLPILWCEWNNYHYIHSCEPGLL